MASAPARVPPVALYLDAWLSKPLMAHVITLCHDLGAPLLCLAPAPGGIAVSRLEPHIGALEQAGLEWRIQPVAGDLKETLLSLQPVAQLVCASGSALARYRGVLPAALVILLTHETLPVRAKVAPNRTVDWLAPRLHRGY